MIARLTGTIAEKEAKSLILEVNGVGYRVAVLGMALNKAAEGVQTTLRIYHQISDDAETLYGFETAEDLEYFNLLLTVPSVGPRTAMNILDAAPPRVLNQAVLAGDIKLLTRVSGVGKKTAERILVELKGKVKDMGTAAVSSGIEEDVLAALKGIGFTAAQAKGAMQKLPQEIKTVEEAVREVLRHK